MRRLLLVLLVAFAFSATPADAAFNHVEVCKATLRGYFGSDDDVHMFGVSTGATGFSGWGTYWHGDSGGVWVYGYFYGGLFTYGLGHCWDGDYGPDRMG